MRGYQIDSEQLDYEVLVLDNNSSECLSAEDVEACGPEFKYHFLKDAPPSPAYALNFGAEHSTGDILCFMIDGAHLITPGVFKFALSAFRAFNNPVVMTRYFFLGPEEQNESILKGYNQQAEDGLLKGINWPEDGYRLFEIGVPLQGEVPKITWFNKMIETNCLFVSRKAFADIGGADERFDIPGGGFLNLDLYKSLADLPDSVPVQMIGEGSFHQYHGGTTTNVTPEERDAKVDAYNEQYLNIRGAEFEVSDKDLFYLGHLPTRQSKIHLRNPKKNNRPIPQGLKDALSGAAITKKS
jgi:glycosyltransferase involved in cell wall biosynthesis